ncbi:uncharacterized protein LOC114714521 [Neltuma alba]|uniref:uncharacterized protein LOC114714521 n=1 Tax=Neltuma alba TaxID=207710 RepID=UPI0010A377B7|nr:uncharacterized protein LOC114714521 [Prosopis alba]
MATWNCRGAGGRLFSRMIKEIVIKYGINVLCLVETRISGLRADKMVRKSGFTNWIRVEASGFAGGIWVLWKDNEVGINYICSNTQMIHCQIHDRPKKEKFYATFVYGETMAYRRIELWESLKVISNATTEPWVIVGDFNTFLTPSDKLGGAAPILPALQHFASCISESQLVELPVVGEKFTWEKQGVKERLDWAFSNVEWALKFPQSKAAHGMKFKSDHRIVLVSNHINTPTDRPRERSFRYQSAWEDASNWNNSVVGSIPQKKRQILRRLEGIDKARQDKLSSGFYRLEKKLWKDYVKLAAQEELLWFQKSRCNWLQWGDKNTRFFHASTVIRRRQQHIETLQNDDGRWVTDHSEMMHMATLYYKKLYTKDDQVSESLNWLAEFPSLSTQDIYFIHKELNMVEIKNAAFMMGAFKAPGPDGLQPHFF